MSALPDVAPGGEGLEKLEELEGNLVKEVSSNSEDKNAFGIGGLEEGEVKVRGTLLRSAVSTLSQWRSTE